MKNTLIIIFLFIKFSCLSQDIESIKKLDTVYIYFNHMKYEKYSNIGGTSNKNKMTTYLYQFYFDTYNYVYFISRNYNDFDDFDDFEKGIKTDIKKVKKKFLRKNKEKILDINFFLRNGFLETFNALYVPRKVIYLIDSKEIKGRYVILKEIIRMDAPNYTPE